MFNNTRLLVSFDFLLPTSGVLLIAKSLKKQTLVSRYGQHKNLQSLKRGLVLLSISRVCKISASLGFQMRAEPTLRTDLLKTALRDFSEGVKSICSVSQRTPTNTKVDENKEFHILP